MGYNQMTALYPMIAGAMILICLAPLALSMAVSRKAGTMFYDEEHAAGVDGRFVGSAEFWLLVLLGHLALCAVLGFVLGSALFIFGFLVVFGRAKPWQALLGAAGFVLILGLLSNQLTLRYPEGLLQTWANVNLPWPLQ
jgi:putative tricarboxylic transport membrane protein